MGKAFAVQTRLTEVHQDRQLLSLIRAIRLDS
jgi:hypothetical protein